MGRCVCMSLGMENKKAKGKNACMIKYVRVMTCFCRKKQQWLWHAGTYDGGDAKIRSKKLNYFTFAVQHLTANSKENWRKKKASRSFFFKSPTFHKSKICQGQKRERTHVRHKHVSFEAKNVYFWELIISKTPPAPLHATCTAALSSSKRETESALCEGACVPHRASAASSSS